VSRFYLGQRAVEVAFDDENLVANAGLALVGALCTRIGLAGIISDKVRLHGRVGGANPAYKSLSLIFAMVAGASHIDHLDILRSGATGAILPFPVAAPSTVGTYLRSFTFGHLRQLDEVIEAELNRAWGLGMAPARDQPLVIDIDSTIAEVSGYQKQGAAYGYTRKLGYHPLLAVRAETGEILGIRMRKGSANTQRGIRRHVAELVARVRRLGHGGEIILRFDSGFQSDKTLEDLCRLGASYTMAIHANARGAKEIIAAIPEQDWTAIAYTEGGQAQVTETTYKARRLIVRRTRLLGAQAELFPNWRYFAFVTDLEGSAVELDAFHRARARVELSIRDLKENAGLAHVPSGKFFANGAWLAHAVLAHNLIRHVAYLGELVPSGTMVTGSGLRTHIVALPGRLVNRSGRWVLRTPARWPFAKAFTRALELLVGPSPVPI
jgi:hypothetical protein